MWLETLGLKPVAFLACPPLGTCHSPTHSGLLLRSSATPVMLSHIWEKVFCEKCIFLSILPFSEPIEEWLPAFSLCPVHLDGWPAFQGPGNHPQSWLRFS